MQAPQPMDIDPIDDGPRSLSSPNGNSSDRTNNFQVITLPATISKEEDARKAIEMLRGEDSTARVSAAHRLDSIASVLGPERTRDVSLFPYTAALSLFYSLSHIIWFSRSCCHLSPMEWTTKMRYY